MFKKILVCSDGSDHAMNAAEAVAEIAGKFGSSVILLNVFSLYGEPAFLGLESAPVYWDIPEEAHERTQEAVERRTGRIFDKAGVKYNCIRERGHAVGRIVDVAKRETVDLIVMGSRGLGGVSRFFLGSASDGVLHHAHCPVLIVR